MLFTPYTLWAKSKRKKNRYKIRFRTDRTPLPLVSSITFYMMIFFTEMRPRVVGLTHCAPAFQLYRWAKLFFLIFDFIPEEKNRILVLPHPLLLGTETLVPSIRGTASKSRHQNERRILMLQSVIPAPPPYGGQGSKMNHERENLDSSYLPTL